MSLVFPGTGLVLFGQEKRALVWMGAFVGAIVLAIVWAWSVVLAAAIAVATAIDGYRCAARTDGRPHLQEAIIACCAELGVLALLVYVIAQPFKTPSSSMYPTLHIGDYVLVDKLSPQWRPIGRGDIIAFQFPCNPSRDYIKRVVAVGGDTVEVRCSVVYVNGKAAESQLVAADTSYEDYDETAPDPQWYRRPVSEYRETLDGVTYGVYQDVERPSRAGHETQGDQRDFPMVDRPFPPGCTSQMDAARPIKQDEGRIVPTKPDAGPCEPQLHYVVPDGNVFVLGDNRFNSNDSRFWGVVRVGAIRGRARAIIWSRHLSRIGSVH